MLRVIIFHLTLTAALFAPGVFATLNYVTSQNGVTATGQYNIDGSGSIAVSWTRTCTVCSWQLSTKYNNEPWVIQKTLPKGSTQFTITGLRPGQEYLVKMDAKRANRWLNRALFTNMTGKDPNADDGTILKQIIFFGRHGIRSSVWDETTLEQYSPDPYPPFKDYPPPPSAEGLPDTSRTGGGKTIRHLLPRVFVPRRTPHGQRYNRSITLVFSRQFHSALKHYRC